MQGRRVGVILCGGNIDLALFRDWVLDPIAAGPHGPEA
jgi:threonine dehydratase